MHAAADPKGQQASGDFMVMELNHMSLLAAGRPVTHVSTKGTLTDIPCSGWILEQLPRAQHGHTDTLGNHFFDVTMVC
jgi:hypothetical protein